jgi:hypothetical protein
MCLCALSTPFRLRESTAPSCSGGTDVPRPCDAASHRLRPVPRRHSGWREASAPSAAAPGARRMHTRHRPFHGGVVQHGTPTVRRCMACVRVGLHDIETSRYVKACSFCRTPPHALLAVGHREDTRRLGPLGVSRCPGAAGCLWVCWGVALEGDGQPSMVPYLHPPYEDGDRGEVVAT